jgi:hypothetical protein
MPVPIFVCEVACASGFAGARAREVCYPMLGIFLLQKMMIQTVPLKQYV